MEARREKNRSNYEKQGLFVEDLERKIHSHGVQFAEILTMKNKYKTIDESSCNRTNYRSRLSTTSRVVETRFVEDRTTQAYK